MAAWGTKCEDLTIPGAEGVASIRCLEPLFANIIAAVLAFVGVGLFLILIINGFNFLTAGSDQKKLEKAKSGTSAALLGIILIAAAYLIIRLIEVFAFTNPEAGPLHIFRIWQK